MKQSYSINSLLKSCSLSVIFSLPVIHVINLLQTVSIGHLREIKTIHLSFASFGQTVQNAFRLKTLSPIQPSLATGIFLTLLTIYIVKSIATKRTIYLLLSFFIAILFIQNLFDITIFHTSSNNLNGNSKSLYNLVTFALTLTAMFTASILHHDISRSATEKILTPLMSGLTIIYLFSIGILIFFPHWYIFSAASTPILLIPLFKGIPKLQKEQRYSMVSIFSLITLSTIPIGLLFQVLTQTYQFDILFPLLLFSMVLFIVSVENKTYKLNKSSKMNESDDKLDRIFNKTEAGTFLVSFNGTMEKTNQAMANIFGYSNPEEMIQSITNTAEQLITNGRDREKLLKDLKQYKYLSDFETKTLNRNGDIIRIKINIHLKTDTQMKKQYYEGYIEDLTIPSISQGNPLFSENKYKILYESMIDGFAQINMRGDLVEFNQSFRKMLGYENNEMYQLSYEGITPEKWHDYEKLILESEVIKKGYSKFYEKEYIRKDGTLFPVELRTHLIRNNSGDPIGMWAIIKDIRERKRLENIWKQYELIVNTSQEFMTIINKDYRYEAVNDSFCNAHNKQREQIVGKSVKELWGEPSFGIDIKPNLDKCIKGYSVFYQSRFNFGILGERHLDIGFYPYFGENATVTHIIVISHDITERIKTEHELLKSKEELENRVAERTAELVTTNDILKSEIRIRAQVEYELRVSEEKYRKLIETMTDGLIVLDNSATVTYVNSKMIEMLNYDEESLIGSSIYNYVDEANTIIMKEQLQKRKKGIHDPYEIEWKDKNDNLIKSIVSPQILYNESKTFIGSFGVITDITERKKAEEELKKAKETAEFANKAKSTFLANISHEIRTPMNAIMGFSELLGESISENNEKQYLSAIISSGKTLLDLINDILDLSKIESGKFNLEYTAVNIRQVLEEIKLMFSQKVNQKKLSLSIVIDSKVPEFIQLDSLRIRQILLNLISNAVKFTDKGNIKISLSYMEIDAADGLFDMAISVQDSGQGIRKDQLDIIFEPFIQQSGQSTTQYGGTGLGLTITKRIVEMMDGKITVESEVAKGSIFTITLPKLKKASLRKTANTLDIYNSASFVFPEASILIADDVATNRTLLKSYLKDHLFSIIEVENGQQCITAAKENKPDIIFLDLKMPILDGRDAIKIIRNDKTLKNITVIAVTASVLEDDEIDLSLFDSYLVKPLNKKDLFNEMAKFLLPIDIKTEKSAIIENFSISSLPDTDIDNIPELIDILENRIMKNWNQVQKGFIFTDIKDFALTVKNLGKQNNLAALIKWSDALHNQANIFDMDNISSTLSIFPDLIKQIKALYKDRTDH